MREIIFDMLHVIKPVNLSIEFTVALESGRINFTFIIEWYEVRGYNDCLFYLKFISNVLNLTFSLFYPFHFKGIVIGK